MLLLQWVSECHCVSVMCVFESLSSASNKCNISTSPSSTMFHSQFVLLVFFFLAEEEHNFKIQKNNHTVNINILIICIICVTMVFTKYLKITIMCFNNNWSKARQYVLHRWHIKITNKQESSQNDAEQFQKKIRSTHIHYYRINPTLIIY